MTHERLSPEVMLDRIVAGLEEKSLAVFCGAGISAASGLPVVPKIINTILKRLEIPGDDEKRKGERYELIERILNGQKEDKEKKLDAFPAIPFEKFMEIFFTAQPNLDRGEFNSDQVAEFCKIFRYRNVQGLPIIPNAQHQIWGRLLLEGIIPFLVTTNFDLGFDLVLQQGSGGGYKNHYDQQTNRVIKDFEKVSDLHGKYIKIHGSADDPQSVIITIQGLTSEANENYASRQTLLRKIFSRQSGCKSVLFLGYSCSDIFDVVPALYSLSETGDETGDKKDHLENIYFWQHWNEEELPEKVKKMFPPAQFPQFCYTIGDTQQLADKLLSKYGYSSEAHGEPAPVDENWQESVMGSIIPPVKELLLFTKARFYYELEQREKSYEVLSSLVETTSNPYSLAACYGNMALILRDWGRLDEAMDLHKKELKLSKALGDKSQLARCYGNRAVILQVWGRLDEAMELHKKELKLSESLGDKNGLARCYGNMAVILKNWRKLEEAMKLFEKQEKLSESLGDKSGLASCYSNMALILRDRGKLDEAMELFEKQEKLSKALGDKSGLARCYGNMAVILQQREKLAEAMELHEKELKLSESLGDKNGLARCYVNMATILSGWEKLDEAMPLLSKAEKLFEKIGNKSGLASCYANMALILRDWEKLDEAMPLLSKAEKLFEALGDKSGLASCYANMALILRDWEKLDEAMPLLSKAEKLFEALGDKSGLARCYSNMALILAMGGNLTQAEEKISSAISLAQEVGAKPLLRQLEELQNDINGEAEEKKD